MDFPALIEQLKAQKAALDRAIAVLEGYQGDKVIAPEHLPSRGRKSMSPEERLQVSQRMRRYWANKAKS